MTANLNDLIETTKPKLEKALVRTEGITEKLDALLAKSNLMMASLATDKGAVGALLHDEKVKSEVKETIACVKEAASTAKDVFGRITQFKVYWNYDWRYEHSVRTSRVDIGLKILPREGRYYYVGGSNLANVSDDKRGSKVDYVQPNKADALLGWEGGWYDVGIGVLRSGGGGRVTLTPFHKDPMRGASPSRRRRMISAATARSRAASSVSPSTTLAPWSRSRSTSASAAASRTFRKSHATRPG